MLFAPFFAVAAGTGHVWFWRQAIDRPNLWYHFQRFNEALEGIDPPAEQFEPIRIDNADLRIYALRGKTTLLAWCRDRKNDWRSELEEGTPPRTMSGIQLNCADLGFNPAILHPIVRTYDPWRNQWESPTLFGTMIVLPDFWRSLVIRIHCETAGEDRQ